MTRRYRPHGEGSATGAEEHALALESAWSRNAYGARHTEDLYEVMRSVENRLGTITSLRWTEDGAWVSLRTSRIPSNPCGTVPTYPSLEDPCDPAKPSADSINGMSFCTLSNVHAVVPRGHHKRMCRYIDSWASRGLYQ